MPDTPLDPRRKRLLWRATHRGIREMDIVLGGFAGARLGAMDERELDELEAIIETPDQDLLGWITGMAEPPPAARNPTFDALMGFRP